MPTPFAASIGSSAHVDDAHTWRQSAESWPQWITIPSTVAQVAAVRGVAAQRRDEDRADGTLIAATCPRPGPHQGLTAVVRQERNGTRKPVRRRAIRH
ncbi:hypothetical protein [Kibdelosporangium philippinense]|uniref:hypothetical protein n=1 Tax=Kibdelosporangium philippinense TaxID=211113 RepID=UPI00361FB752